MIELPIRYRGLAVLGISREPMVLVVSRNNKLGGSRGITPAQLKKRPLILLSRDADLAHDEILAGLESWGFRPEKVIEVINLGQVLDFVGAGEGVGVVRASARRFESKNIALRPMPALPMLHVGLAYRRDIRSPLVRNLLEVAREVFAMERKGMIEDHPKSP